MRYRLLPVTFALALTTMISCDGDSIIVDPPAWDDTGDGLSLEVSLPRAIVPVGETDTLTMRLTNHTGNPVRLRFGSTCQILPFIETASGEPALPVGGWGCGAALTELTVPANGVITRPFAIRGVAAASASPMAGLVPGNYRAIARVDARPTGPTLQSRYVEFEVR